jgi:autotransporter-associated beta strand protein
MGSSGANPDAEFDLNGWNQEVAGLSLTGTAAKNSVTNSSPSLSTLTVNTAFPSTFGGILKGNLTLVKTGADTLTLSGLSATAANNHTGTSIIGAGTLAISANNPAFTGGLTFGSANGTATPGAMELGTSSATYAGPALVRTNSATANAISIGAARTLTLSGGMTLGFDAGGGTGQTNSRLTVTGQGSMVVNGTTIVIGVNQAATNAAYSNRGTLDVSALSAFGTNVTNFNIGVGNNTQGPGDVILSNTANTILATTLQVGNTGSNNGYGTSTLTLGTGTNVIQADTIHIGRNKGSGPGVVKFASQDPGSPGTVVITDKAGTGRANIDIANQLTNGTASGAVGTLDLRGHAAMVSAGTVTIGAVTAGGTGGPTGTLSFDAGTFDVNTLNLAPKSGASTGTARATVNIGGGTFTVNTAFSLGSQTGGGASVATLNLTGGTFSSNVDILGGAGATTSTLTLDGASAILDMRGRNITNLDGITYTNGTLNNLGVVNTAITLAGTGSRVFDQDIGISGEIQGGIAGPGLGLTKQGLGTLTLSGANTYTGDTTVNAGTLVLAGNAQLKFVLGDASGSNNQIIGAGTVTLDGGFNIDTSAADALESGTWTLENVSTLTGPYGSNFSVIGFTNAGANKWTKTNGAKLYTFDETTGVLTLAPADAYAGWALAKGLDGSPGKEAGKGDDPDQDGKNNLYEFAFDGNPLSGANDGKIVGKPAPVGPDEVLTLTLPVRNGAVFPVSPGALVSNPIDGIRYIIEGDGSLSPFDDGITEIPAITAGLPGLSAGWSYRTFRSPGIVPTVPKAFLRAKVSEAP